MKKKFKTTLTTFIFFSILTNVQIYANENQISAKELNKVLPQLNDINCKFKQEKILKNIEKPLISGGNFSFIKDKGIFFETTYPIQSTTTYTNKSQSQINDIIIAISNKNFSKLDNKFNFFYKNQNNTWTLTLKPKPDTNTDKYIDSITINGTNSIEKIVILMTDGSKTTQWFSTK